MTQASARQSDTAAASNMHIEEIIIDGFKSYAKRTVVQGFDQQFNAITGLNGSGKSNILDSICFVLGISKLEQVRAGSLQVCCPDSCPTVLSPVNSAPAAGKTAERLLAGRQKCTRSDDRCCSFIVPSSCACSGK